MESKKGFRIAVLSGKGGTGKTMISTNLAALSGDCAYVDCDVEEPNGHLYFPMEEPLTHPVFTSIPTIKGDLCDGCRICVDFCRFHALAFIKGAAKVFEDICRSCGGCGLVCPQNVITYKNLLVGQVQRGEHQGIRIYTGAMDIGKASGEPIIKDLLHQIRKEEGLTVTDCPPGSACIVMESIKNADVCVLVAEPTIFGAHNLTLVHELVSLFHIPYGVVLNKCAGSEDPSEKYCIEHEIPILGRIDYDPDLGRLNAQGKVAVWEDEKYKPVFKTILQAIVRSYLQEVDHEAIIDLKW